MEISFSKLEKYKERLLEILQNDLYNLPIQGWLVGAYTSLRAARELNYEGDRFHTLAREDKHQAQAILIQLIQKDFHLRSISQNRDEEIWASGFHFNTALFRIDSVHDRSVRLMLQEVAGKDYGVQGPTQVMAWSKAMFFPKDEDFKILTMLHKQVSLFRHEHLYSKIEELKTWPDACQAFGEVLRVVEYTTKSSADLKSLHKQHDGASALKKAVP